MTNKVGYEDVDKYYKYQAPRPRSTWKCTKPWSVGMELKTKKDFSICPVCGGTQRTFAEIRPGRKRLVDCPKCAAPQDE